jgi:ATP-dependent DNA helicase RecG
MFLSQRNRYLPMPDYELSTAENVVLRIPGRVIDENYSKILVENSEIDLTTAVLMDKVQKGQGINDDAAKSLKKQHLIEGRKPNFFISKKVAKITHQESQYTLNKGYTDEECMEWVVKGLKDHTTLGRQQINDILWTKLPAVLSDEQKLKKIEYILQKMRKKNIIYVDKNRMWRLVEN